MLCCQWKKQHRMYKSLAEGMEFCCYYITAVISFAALLLASFPLGPRAFTVHFLLILNTTSRNWKDEEIFRSEQQEVRSK